MSDCHSGNKIFSNSREMLHNPTESEARLWQELRANRFNNVHFRRQHVIGKYIVDFCASRQKLVIEVDGGQHLEQRVYDDEREAFLESKGYRVLRFWNNDVLNNMEGVILSIMEALKPPPQPSPK